MTPYKTVFLFKKFLNCFAVHDTRLECVLPDESAKEDLVILTCLVYKCSLLRAIPLPTCASDSMLI